MGKFSPSINAAQFELRELERMRGRAVANFVMVQPGDSQAEVDALCEFVDAGKGPRIMAGRARVVAVVVEPLSPTTYDCRVRYAREEP